MCGLCGALIGQLSTRRIKEIDALADTFIRLLLASEHRGPHATGVAWIKRDGSMHMAKESLPARAFVQQGTFLDWLLGVDRQVTYLMGHTRWPSHGSVRNPANNHPLVYPILENVPLAGKGSATARGHGHRSSVGRCAVTHNGTILRPETHFSHLGLPRTTQVDSELLARLTQRYTDMQGIDVDGFLAALSPLDGSMSLALAATTRPEEIILLKGNMPLEVRLHRRKRVVLYASESRILDTALNGEVGWEDMPVAPGEALAINTAALHAPRRYRFTFQGLARQSGWHRCTGT
ncbi:MAG: class II glutamine amidotransferase [Armatimonadota bacterium]